VDGPARLVEHEVASAELALVVVPMAGIAKFCHGPLRSVSAVPTGGTGPPAGWYFR
jgi:hypothetical protein